MVSSLYDRTIEDTLSRLANEAELNAKSSCDDDTGIVSNGVAIGLVTVCILMGLLLAVIGVAYCLRLKKERQSDLEKPIM